MTGEQKSTLFYFFTGCHDSKLSSDDTANRQDERRIEATVEAVVVVVLSVPVKTDSQVVRLH